MDKDLNRCEAVAENPEQIRKEREYFREEHRRLESENNELRNLIVKLMFERYGFGR